MSDLIEELITEHKAILALLNEVKSLGILSKSGQQKFLSARDLLISHMNKEDEQYYPALIKAAENNKNLKIMLDYFITDMEVVSTRAMHLFNKYAQGEYGSDFAGDLKLLYITLKDRIHTEEETLFKKFSPLAKE